MKKIFFAGLLLIMLNICPCNVAAMELPPVTSSFGWRTDPVTGAWAFHAGVDFGLAYGSEIYSLFDGIIADAGNHGDGYGNQILIYHQNIDSYTRYGHCAEIYVCIGQTVDAGSIIGTVGSTGKSTGPHLHLEYIVHTENGYEYADPLLLWK